MPVTTRGVSGNSVSTTTNNAGKTVGSARNINEKQQSVNVGSTRDAGKSLGNAGGRNSSMSGMVRPKYRPNLGEGALSPEPPPVAPAPVASTPALSFNPQMGVWTSGQQMAPVPQSPQMSYAPGLSQNDFQSWLMGLQNISAPPMPMNTFDYLQYVQPYYKGGM